MTNWSTDSVDVLLGMGGGAYAAPFSLAIEGIAFGLVTADFDQDGLADLAATSFGTWPNAGSVTVFYNDGAASFVAGQVHPAQNGTWRLHGGDLDCDGRIDLLAVNRNSDSVSMLRNAGGRSFAEPLHTRVGQFPISSTLADFDSDGDLDAAVPSNNGDDVYVLENDGEGGLALEIVLTAPGFSLLTSAAGDIDGDGDRDLVIGRSGTLWTFENIGHQSWRGLGFSLAGTGGVSPLLSGKGPSGDGSAIGWSLRDARPVSSAFLIVSPDPLLAPFLGGILVPDVATGIVLIDSTDGAGAIGVTATLPDGLPSGFDLFFQYWVTDATGPRGFTASNGVSLTLE